MALPRIRRIRLRVPSLVLAPLGALASAAFVAAFLTSTNATQPRFFPADPPKPSPFLVGPVAESTEGACQITADVVDPSEGNAARAGVDVTLDRVTADGSVEQWRALSDHNGVHRFVDLAPGTYQLTARVDDRMPAGAPEFTCGGAGERAFFTLPLAKAEHVFTGVVTSTNGKPAAGAELAIAQDVDARTSLAGVARVPVNADGTFSMRVLPGKYQLLVQAPHHATMVRKLRFDDDARSPKSTMHLALVPAPRVTGRVVDENGDPVVGALVAAGGVLDPKQHAPTTTTDNDGAFSLPIVDGMDVTVTARAANDHGGLVAVRPLGIAATALGFDGVELVALKGRSVEGLVTKPDGDAWAFGDVHYRVRALGLQGTEKADKDGHFVLAGMPLDADVEVWAEGNASGAWGAQVASPGSDQLALVYTPPAY